MRAAKDPLGGGGRPKSLIKELRDPDHVKRGACDKAGGDQVNTGALMRERERERERERDPQIKLIPWDLYIDEYNW